MYLYSVSPARNANGERRTTSEREKEWKSWLIEAAAEIYGVFRKFIWQQAEGRSEIKIMINCNEHRRKFSAECVTAERCDAARESDRGTETESERERGERLTTKSGHLNARSRTRA